MRTLAVLVFAMMVLPLAGQGLRYGVITAGDTPARAGTASDAETVTTLAADSVVEVVSTRGAVAEVRLPGRFSLFASETWKGAKALRLDEGQRAIVTAADLPMRVAARSTAASLGTFRRNASLRVLGGPDPAGWVEVLAPRDTSLFIPADRVDTSMDQAALARRFAALMGETEGSVETEAEAEATTTSTEDRLALRELETRYDRVLKEEGSAAEIGTLRGAYEDLARRVGPETDVGRAASSRATYLRRRENIAASLETADRRISRLEGQLGEAEAGYEEEILRLRRERRERLRTGMDTPLRPEPRARFLEHGIGRIYPDFGETFTDERGVFILTKAGERRYRLISDRYDLSEYIDKTIGITRWTILDDGSKSPWAKVLVDRIEVLR